MRVHTLNTGTADSVSNVDTLFEHFHLNINGTEDYYTKLGIYKIEHSTEICFTPEIF